MARRALAISAGALLVVVVAALGVWLWLGSYSPLRALDSGFAPGPGIGADVQPVAGSGGRPVFFPLAHRRTFDAAFTLRNAGRFAVTVMGLEPSKPGPTPYLGAALLLATTSSAASADPSQLAPFGSLRIDPGDSAIVVVRFILDCKGATAATPDVYTSGVRLRYRYLSLFRRTETVRLPFAVTLRCVGGPPPAP